MVDRHAAERRHSLDADGARSRGHRAGGRPRTGWCRGPPAVRAGRDRAGGRGRRFGLDRWRRVGSQSHLRVTTGPLTEEASRHWVAVFQGGPRAFLDGASALIAARSRALHSSRIRVWCRAEPRCAAAPGSTSGRRGGGPPTTVADGGLPRARPRRWRRSGRALGARRTGRRPAADHDRPAGPGPARGIWAASCCGSGATNAALSSHASCSTCSAACGRSASSTSLARCCGSAGCPSRPAGPPPGQQRSATTSTSVGRAGASWSRSTASTTRGPSTSSATRCARTPSP